MLTILAWPLTFLSLMFMVPWARWLLRRDSNPLLLLLTTLALSVGTLSLVMLWIGLAGLRIDWRLATAICSGIALGGFVALRLRPKVNEPVRAGLLPMTRRPIVWAAVGVIGLIAGLIVFNAVYWPFGIDDAIAIYGWYGKAIALSGQLPHGTLYETYPMLVPLSYAFTHQAAGWIDEHLAALIPALLSVGVLGVAYLLGAELYDRTTGLSAALLIALTPTITHWASTGYVDLPTAFFYGLTGLFLLRQRRTRTWQDALLAGIMAGLAAWTKNSGLLIVISIVGWIAYCAWLARHQLPRPLSRRDVSLIALGFLAVCGPWYARNLRLAGLLVPPTGWTWKAERTLNSLFPYLQDSRYFVAGWVLTAGLLYSLWQVWRSRGNQLAPTALVIFYVPFFVIWWALFSYDGRFLLVLTPLSAVMGGHVVQNALRRLIPPSLLPQPRVTALAIGALLLTMLPAANAAVDYKPEVLRHPFMSDAEKHRLRLGERYDVASYLSTLSPAAKIWTQDLLLPYYVDQLQVTVGNLPTPEQLNGYQYWVASPGQALPDQFSHATPLYTKGGYQVYTLPLSTAEKG